MIFFILLSTKEDILKVVGDQTVDSSYWLPYGKKQYGMLLPIFFKISSFVLNRRKKTIQVWNYPLKCKPNMFLDI